MFDFLVSVLKAATVVVTVPVGLVVDAIEMVGIKDASPTSHTWGAIDDMVENLEDATRPNGK